MPKPSDMGSSKGTVILTRLQEERPLAGRVVLNPQQGQEVARDKIESHVADKKTGGKDYMLRDGSRRVGVAELGNLAHRDKQEDRVAFDRMPGFDQLTPEQQKNVMELSFAAVSAQVDDNRGLDEAGSTATSCVSYTTKKDNTTQLHVVTANLADSPAFIFKVDKEGRIIHRQRLVDELHKPRDIKEEDRVNEAGGEVLGGRVYYSTYRDGKREDGQVGLAVARAFGDNKFNHHMEVNKGKVEVTPNVNSIIIHNPSISTAHIDIAEGEKVFVLVTCDGAVEKNGRALGKSGEKNGDDTQHIQAILAGILENNPNCPQDELCRRLVEEALRAGSTDNISAIVHTITAEDPPAAPVMISVFDGHGGDQVADIAAKMLPGEMQRITSKFVVENKEAEEKKAEASPSADVSNTVVASSPPPAPRPPPRPPQAAAPKETLFEELTRVHAAREKQSSPEAAQPPQVAAPNAAQREPSNPLPKTAAGQPEKTQNRGDLLEELKRVHAASERGKPPLGRQQTVAGEAGELIKSLDEAGKDLQKMEDRLTAGDDNYKRDAKRVRLNCYEAIKPLSSKLPIDEAKHAANLKVARDCLQEANRLLVTNVKNDLKSISALSLTIPNDSDRESFMSKTEVNLRKLIEELEQNIGKEDFSKKLAVLLESFKAASDQIEEAKNRELVQPAVQAKAVAPTAVNRVTIDPAAIVGGRAKLRSARSSSPGAQAEKSAAATSPASPTAPATGQVSAAGVLSSAVVAPTSPPPATPQPSSTAAAVNLPPTGVVQPLAASAEPLSPPVSQPTAEASQGLSERFNLGEKKGVEAAAVTVANLAQQLNRDNDKSEESHRSLVSLYRSRDQADSEELKKIADEHKALMVSRGEIVETLAVMESVLTNKIDKGTLEPRLHRLISASERYSFLLQDELVSLRQSQLSGNKISESGYEKRLTELNAMIEARDNHTNMLKRVISSVLSGSLSTKTASVTGEGHLDMSDQIAFNELRDSLNTVLELHLQKQLDFDRAMAASSTALASRPQRQKVSTEHAPSAQQSQLVAAIPGGSELTGQGVGKWKEQAITFDFFKTKGDGSCGFYSLPVPNDRQGVVKLLLAHSNEKDVRDAVVSEISGLMKMGVITKENMPVHYQQLKIFEDELIDLQSKIDDELRKVLDRIDPARKLPDRSIDKIVEHLEHKPSKTDEDKRDLKILSSLHAEYKATQFTYGIYCGTDSVIQEFINNYVGGGGKLSFTLPTSDGVRELSFLDAVVKYSDPPIHLVIWERDANLPNQLHIAYEQGPVNAAVTHVYHSPGQDSHFELMAEYAGPSLHATPGGPAIVAERSASATPQAGQAPSSIPLSRSSSADAIVSAAVRVPASAELPAITISTPLQSNKAESSPELPTASDTLSSDKLSSTSTDNTSTRRTKEFLAIDRELDRSFKNIIERYLQTTTLAETQQLPLSRLDDIRNEITEMKIRLERYQTELINMPDGRRGPMAIFKRDGESSDKAKKVELLLAQIGHIQTNLDKLATQVPANIAYAADSVVSVGTAKDYADAKAKAEAFIGAPLGSSPSIVASDNEPIIHLRGTEKKAAEPVRYICRETSNKSGRTSQPAPREVYIQENNKTELHFNPAAIEANARRNERQRMRQFMQTGTNIPSDENIIRADIFITNHLNFHTGDKDPVTGAPVDKQGKPIRLTLRVNPDQVSDDLVRAIVLECMNRGIDPPHIEPNSKKPKVSAMQLNAYAKRKASVAFEDRLSLAQRVGLKQETKEREAAMPSVTSEEPVRPRNK